MEPSQLLFVAVLSLLASLPAVWLIPRARQSPAFDRVLGSATWVLAVIGASIAPGYLSGILPETTFFVDLPVLATRLGAVGGAFSINGVLWLLDRFDRPDEQEFMEEDADERPEGKSNRPKKDWADRVVHRAAFALGCVHQL